MSIRNPRDRREGDSTATNTQDTIQHNEKRSDELHNQPKDNSTVDLQPLRTHVSEGEGHVRGRVIIAAVVIMLMRYRSLSDRPTPLAMKRAQQFIIRQWSGGKLHKLSII